MSASCSSHSKFEVAAARAERPAAVRTAAPAACTEEALRILDLLDAERFGEATAAIEKLPDILGGGASATALQDLLRGRLDRAQSARCATLDATVEVVRREAQRADSFREESAPAMTPPPSPAPLTCRRSVAAAVEVETLKRSGMDLYSEGKVEDALDCWRQALDLDPADEEVQRFVRRAEAVLSRQHGR